MSAATEFLIGVYIAYMMIANYPKFKEQCNNIWKP
jgi:hypothetical protein